MTSKNNTPIIFMHYGCPDYLKCSLMQAKKYNPNSRIILIGDESNENCVDFVEHYMFNNFHSEKFEEFKKNYIHLSNNAEDYELFCIKRWFILYEFGKNHPEIENFLYIDSDVLLFCDIEEEAQKFKKYDFSLIGFSAHICYLKNYTILEGLNDFIVNLYKDPIAIALLKSHFYINSRRGISEGISDMYLFTQYAHFIGLEKVIFLNKPIDNSIYDNIFFFSPENTIFEVQDGKLYRINFETNEKLQYKALHLQGHTKKYISKIYKTQKVPILHKTRKYIKLKRNKKLKNIIKNIFIPRIKKRMK